MQYVAKPIGVREFGPDDIQSPTLEAQLERLVDREGLAYVLESLSNVCWSKACHLEETWQDHKSAKVWHKIAKAVSKVALDCEGM